MNNITKDLEPLKNKLRNHPLYNNIYSIEDLKIFFNFFKDDGLVL